MTTLNLDRYLSLEKELSAEKAKIQEFLKPFVRDFYDFLADADGEEDITSGFMAFIKVASRRLGSHELHLMSLFDYTPSSFSFQGYEKSEQGEFFLTENTRALEGMGFFPIPKGFVDDSERWKEEFLAEVAAEKNSSDSDN